MFNPVAAGEALKKELADNPKILEQWNTQAGSDPLGVKKAIIDTMAKHGIKMNEGQLKMALGLVKPLLGKLQPAIKEHAEQLIGKLF